VYSAKFSPHQPDTIVSCSSDGLLKVWDIKAPTGSATAALTIPAHPTEVLSCAWNYYVPYLVATASVDRTVKVHDIRMASSGPVAPDAPLPPSSASASTVATLLGHEYAVRRVAFSPHSANVLASAGYDMTARVWHVDSSSLAQQQPGGGAAIKWGPSGTGPGALSQIHDLHSEFVVGLGWSLYDEGVLATTSWDCETHIFRAV
jgi:peroxin-7